MNESEKKKRLGALDWMILILVVSYAIVAIFDMMRIKKIPLADALKNVE